MDEAKQKSPFIQDVINQIRVRHYSRRTEETYVHWIKRFIYFHGKRHLETVRTLHERDLAEGFGSVYLPFALSRKYPNADREWKWQYVFPATLRSVDPRSGVTRRHHVD